MRLQLQTSAAGDQTTAFAHARRGAAIQEYDAQCRRLQPGQSCQNHRVPGG